MKKKYIFLVSLRGFGLYRSRKNIIDYFLKNNFNVVLITSNDQHSRSLVRDSVILEEVSFNKSKLSAFKDLTSMFKLCVCYIKYKPELVHNFNLKPIIFSSLASIVTLSKSKIVNTVTGVGSFFSFHKYYRMCIELTLKFIKTRVSFTIFQNHDDYYFLLKKMIVQKEKSSVILGSGVDTNEFKPTISKNKEEVNVIFVSRLLVSKGVYNFISMAESLKLIHPNVSFILGGEYDLNHPDSVSPKMINKAIKEKKIKFIGYVSDMPALLKKGKLFVFPSTYREGLPRVVMEAMACSLTVVAANVPGTREVVLDKKTGFLFPKENPKSMIKIVDYLLKNDSKSNIISVNARNYILENFSSKIILQKHIKIYKNLI